jgi:voltage-gated potassium channel
MALLDLAAIAPAVIPAVTADLRFLRIPRLLRLLRLAKLSRYSPALAIIGRVLYRKRIELLVVATSATLLMIVAAVLMYMLESPAQPDQFSSIPAAMWWTVVTLTTVGYGDIYPVTVAGKVVASLIATLGIGLFALPTAILGSAFLAEVSDQRAATCPHCGKSLSS